MVDGRLRRSVGLSGVMDLRSCVARAVERRWRLGHSRGDGVGGCAATIAEPRAMPRCATNSPISACRCALGRALPHPRSEEHTSELQSLMRISYAVFCLKKKKKYNR